MATFLCDDDRCCKAPTEHYELTWAETTERLKQISDVIAGDEPTFSFQPVDSAVSPTLGGFVNGGLSTSAYTEARTIAKSLWEDNERSYRPCTLANRQVEIGSQFFSTFGVLWYDRGA